ncbi:erv26 super protein [Elasticomyces elasticus]|uniref:Erv26 superfamily protein n=1 Tax=Elasticomyces elasticus TaxID=574655 RepID=A0AAN7ZRM7_9PEZI|nr:erv26 super protein [Elasticomyces elasticus]KAK3632117.1 erv26 super protein [Elasticomyces elasticus]KAK4898856.1 erv26 superfamily protein [Elasticomyces elasticus]KAK4923741.1 erv26 superfamily protein [Elasticomyces elasticus]KAK4951882.1 erv26 superfamily protein [Elasticomyces elasticus]
MWILPLLGYLGLLLGFLFLTLAIASGLYYLSELVEEHTVLAKKILTRMIYAVIALQLLLTVVDKFPYALSALSVGSHVVYMQNLRRFPIVKLTDPIFILSCVLVLANHWLWFRHFSAPPQNHERYNFYAQQNAPSFTEIASFFGLSVWLVPFALFVSLSAGENVLPSMGSEYATGQGSSFISAGQEPAGVNGSIMGRTRHKRSNTQSGMAKAAVNGVREWVGETGEVMGLWRGERTRPL